MKYFEVTVGSLHGDSTLGVGIGLASKTSTQKRVGTDLRSVGWWCAGKQQHLSPYGTQYCGTKKGQNLGSAFGEGDTIGCGYSMETQEPGLIPSLLPDPSPLIPEL